MNETVTANNPNSRGYLVGKKGNNKGNKNGNKLTPNCKKAFIS